MMKTYSANAAQELAAWLVLATFGLVPRARERIKREIEAHFADAVATHISKGLSQEAGEARALEELGEIRSAAKGFQKKHLTEDEEKWLQSLLTENSSQQHNRRMRFLIALFLSTLFTILMIWLSDPKDVWMSWIWLVPLWTFLLLSAAATLRLSYLTKHGLAGQELWRKFLTLDMVNDVFNVSNSMFWTLLLFSGLSNRSHLAAGGYLLLPMLYLFALGLMFFDKRLRVWRKLGYSLANPDTAMEA
jgi:hypothetical protein